MKKLFTICSLVLTIALVGAGTASAQVSGTTDIDIDFPNLLILYYYDEIDVNIDAEDLAQLFGTAPDDFDVDSLAYAESLGAAIDASAGGAGLEATANVTGTPDAASLSSVQLDLLGVWGVRGLNGNANVQVNPTTNTALVNGTSQIDVSSPQIRTTGGGVWTAAGTPISGFSTTGLGTLQRGDVQLTLDMSAVTASGPHSSTLGGTYTITVARP